MKTLHLTLTKKWFDRHLEDKPEDYRAITPYWIARLYMFNNGEKISMWHAKERLLDLFLTGDAPPFVRPIQYEVAEAKNGYGKNVPMFRKEFIETTIGIGNPDWGAPAHPVFIIKLGKVTESVKP